MHLWGLALKLRFGQALYTSRCAYILCADKWDTCTQIMHVDIRGRGQRYSLRQCDGMFKMRKKNQTNFTSSCHVWFYAFPLNNKDTQNNWTVLDLFPKFFTITLHCLVHVSRIVKLPIHFQNSECFTCLWACLNYSVNIGTNTCIF